MKLIVFILGLSMVVWGQEKGLCSNLGQQFKPIPIDCPHKPNKCPQYFCSQECEPICVYFRNKNVFEKFASKCGFCQIERCNQKGAFQVPLSYCRKVAILNKNEDNFQYRTVDE